MPDKPEPGTGWPGTKSGVKHRVYLSDEAIAIIEDLDEGEAAGNVIAIGSKGP